MGRARYIYFEDDINDLLDKEKNKSQLINKLLRAHFEQVSVVMMDENTLKQHIAILEIKQKADIAIKEVKNGKR